MTEPNSAFEGLVRDFKAAALNAGARDMEATVNPAYDSANVQLHYDLMNAAEKALLDAYAGVVARSEHLDAALHEIRQCYEDCEEATAQTNETIIKMESDLAAAKATIERMKPEERRKSEPPIVVRTPRRVGPLITDKPMHEFPPTMGNRRD